MDNVKQIGTIIPGSKIYMEDYVTTYIKYMEEKYVCDELIFILLGSTAREEDEDVLFISGIASASHTDQNGGFKTLTPQGWEEIAAIREQFFPSLNVVGWAYVQPGYGDFLNEAQLTYHLQNFPNPSDVLYVTDPLDKSASFYRSVGGSPQLKPITGYFIYYDRNEPMHEYLLHCKKELAKSSAPAENPNKQVDAKMTAKLRKVKSKNPQRLFSFTPPNFQKLRQMPSTNPVPLLSGLSFALLFVTIIIGGGLLSSNSRIDTLEKQLNSVGKSYIALKDEVEKTYSVFASANTVQEEATEDTSVPATEEPAAPAFAQSDPKTYTVQAGDTLIYISRYFYGTDAHVEEIMKANDLSSPNQLIEGKTIIIP